MELEEIARKYALKNAVEHGGECNPGAVIGKIFAEEDFDDKGEVTQKAQEVCQEVNELSLEEQEAEINDYEFEEKEDQEHDPLPDLEVDEDREVVVRFAPNPNGPPHLGHARGMTINGELRDKYDGKLILRYDDTDPVTKRPLEEAYEMYREDYEWLGYKPDEVRYSSKNFDTYMDYAEKLIDREKAYVCTCSQEEGQKYRKEGKACPHRDQDAQENRELWRKMRSEDGFSEGEATLKVKTDMEHKNPAIRDFIAFRIIEDADHPITGNQYRVWPMLDFQGAIEDHEMGTTHIVRGKELRASTKRQKFIYDYFDWDYPDIMYWGNVQVSGFDAPMSTSTIAEMVKKGDLEDWDDPRCGTLRALRKRGFEPEAIQQFFIDMGVTENDIQASIESLVTENTRLIDDRTDRHYFVRNPVKLTIRGLPGDIEPELPLHPDHPDRGLRDVDVEIDKGELQVFIEEEDLEDGFLRLKGLCNIEIDGETARYREGDHTEAMDRDAPIIHWLPLGSPGGEVRMPDGEVIEGLVEDTAIGGGEVVQFERFGFVRREESGNNTFFFTHK